MLHSFGRMEEIWQMNCAKIKKHLFDSIIHGTIESVKNIISWHVTGADDTKEAWCMM